MSKRISIDEMIVDPMVYDIISNRSHDFSALLATVRNELLLVQSGKREMDSERLLKIVVDGLDKVNQESAQIKSDYEEARETGKTYTEISRKHFWERRRRQYPNINWDEIEKQEMEDLNRFGLNT